MGEIALRVDQNRDALGLGDLPAGLGGLKNGRAWIEIESLW